jgi:hypothetical protein
VRALVLDTNLLVLLVVGNLDPGLISKHKRTRKFSLEDYLALRAFLTRYPRVIVTPNTATETSNLLRQTDDNTARRLSILFADMMPGVEERYVPSSVASHEREYPRLGLADAVLLAEAPPDSDLLTDDLDLYLAAQGRGRTSFNFGHLQSYE